MSYSLISVLLVLAVGGLILVGLYALGLRFRQWQIQKLFSLIITEPLDMVQNKSGSGGSIFAFLLIVLTVIIIVVLMGSS